MHLCNIFFLKPPLGLPTTCGQNYIAQDTHALLDFSHDGTQPVVVEYEQNYIAQAELHCLLADRTTLPTDATGSNTV